jgi:solute carrier family 39 (zinc transporter), member 1/2/3
MKGILVLSLLLVTKSIRVTNAISFGNQKDQQQYSNNQGSFYQQQEAKKGKHTHVDLCIDGTLSQPSRNPLLRWTQHLPFARPQPSRSALTCRGGHSHHHHAPALDSSLVPFNLPLNVWKVIFQTILTLLNVLCWYVPLKSKHISSNQFLLSMANSFSGGVFLSLAFGHLIPECVHGFAHGYNEVVPYMLVLTGYLLIFFVEKVAFDAHDLLHTHDSDHHHPEVEPLTPSANTAAAMHTDGMNGTSPSVAVSAVMTPVAPVVTGRSAVILLGALAVHSVLEMMALGLADTFGDCALLTLSISLHQPAESIALLVAFLKSGLSEAQIILFLSIFSCMGPIGVLLGMLVNTYAAPIVDSIMLAIVAGTFVYVGATEVIPEEFEDSKHKWKKFGALISGILSILCITQYTMSLGGGH